MEQSIWIIVTIIVALATALAVIALLYSASSNTQESILPTISELGENIKNLLKGQS